MNGIKANEKACRERKQNILRLILEKVKEMKSASVGELREPVKPIKEATWRRYTRGLRPNFYRD